MDSPSLYVACMECYLVLRVVRSPCATVGRGFDDATNCINLDEHGLEVSCHSSLNTNHIITNISFQMNERMNSIMHVKTANELTHLLTLHPLLPLVCNPSICVSSNEGTCGPQIVFGRNDFISLPVRQQKHFGEFLDAFNPGSFLIHSNIPSLHSSPYVLVL